MLKHYCNQLGLPTDCSMDELTRRYRQLAKRTHPDINNEPNSHQKFILLNEAYEYVRQYKLHGNSSNFKKEYTDHWTKYREKANERAREQAAMDYETYINSDAYRYLNALNVLTDHFGFVVAVFIPCFLCYIFYDFGGRKIMLPLLILFLFFSPYIVIGIKHYKKLNWRIFTEALQTSMQNADFQLVIFTFVNVLLFWNYVMITLLPFWVFLLLTGISITILFYKKSLFSRNKKHYHSMYCLPVWLLF